MIIKLRSEKLGEHIHDTIFMGEQEGSLASVGKLVMRIGEWQIFGATLLLGAKSTGGQLIVKLEGWSPDK